MKLRYRDYRPLQITHDRNIKEAALNIDTDEKALLHRYLEENLRGNRTTHVIQSVKKE